MPSSVQAARTRQCIYLLRHASAVGVTKTPHFADGHVEAQWGDVSDWGVELRFAVTSVLLPLSMPPPRKSRLQLRDGDASKVKVTQCQL